MDDVASRRRFFAEEIQACANIRSAALVEALASVPREAFLPPGPWLIRGEGESIGGPRATPDADPRHLYHNVSVAIDPGRQLFNGVPTVVVPVIDALGLSAGSRVLHIGCGLGYYSAVMAHVVGPAGALLAIDVDPALAAAAAENLASSGWVRVRQGDGSEALQEPFDAILVNAGATHPLETWLDALAIGGRLACPITATMPQMGGIGKGVFFVITKRDEQTFDARPLSFVAIYSAVGIRDDSLNPAIGAAFMKGMPARVTRLRRDPHDAGPQCWLHGPAFCLGV